MLCPTLPFHPSLDQTSPNQAAPDPYVLFPHQLPPTRRYDAIPQSTGDHTAVPFIYSQYMATSTKRSKITQFIACQFTAFDMVYVADIQRDRTETVGTLPVISFPDNAPCFNPYLSWLSLLWHTAPFQTEPSFA
jgi:hypothetical protein